MHVCVPLQDNYTGEPFGKLEWEASKAHMIASLLFFKMAPNIVI